MVKNKRQPSVEVNHTHAHTHTNTSHLQISFLHSIHEKLISQSANHAIKNVVVVVAGYISLFLRRDSTPYLCRKIGILVFAKCIFVLRKTTLNLMDHLSSKHF